MSIVSCQQCGKQVSSLAPICDYCGYGSEEASEEDLQRFRERKLRNQIYKLRMTTYAVMTLVIIAFGWFWAVTDGFQAPPSSHGPYYLMGVSAVAYLAVRVMLFRAKLQRKVNRRAMERVGSAGK